MSLVNRSDANNHPSLNFRTRTHSSAPESQPDATGFSGDEPDVDKASVLGFAADFVAEHSAAGIGASTDHLPGSFRGEAPKVSKSAQA
jgi:hypothetical protein